MMRWWGFTLGFVLLVIGCKPMQNSQTEFTLASTTVGMINGARVAASGVYKDDDGVEKVNLTIDQVVHKGQAVGDTLQFGGEAWVLEQLVKGKGRQKDQIVFRKG